ncbi:MAG TPA: ParB/RepB/Spo0J family partition protein [Anaerohalosphaeraceae bacterium]|nr:ParB/RepB/Spo0J family partition protein [Phycisphaerae bacterium]HOK94500.1 ParB/RepB/Spo0J family partition protein [Anaerohalosphaeraceae bacterium]HOL31443.1 ParB/RepB/Spo0J family partition protein [Anaerohalosphaeraceae bacterium]HPC63301.1 ParB/RepB/Spo0J family partition protein [Anaerohalosphaeraceae bacterium]HPO68993.1 ParB/RepB/Spo0J family partition protein [Anaerohalosphaeraceae bacterium]
MTESKKIKKPHLGRGLEALLGPVTKIQENGPAGNQFAADIDLESAKRTLPVNCIRPNPYQPRTSWDEEQLKGLCESIRRNGIIQPIIVRKNTEGYEIIAGERRFRAACMAGLQEVPVLERAATDDEMLELALVENIHRSDLNPIERAKAYQSFINTFNLTQTEAAQRLGEDRTVIANYLRLLDLPTDIKQMLSGGQLTMGHARAILSLPSDDLKRKLANRAMAGRLSVREVERLVRIYIEKKDEKLLKKEKSPHIADLERRLQEVLGTKVNIKPNKRGHRGRIIIDYYSIDEFERLTEKMGLTFEDGD